MKNNFFERHKKKSALGLLLLFLKGRGKYFLILLLALFASAPLVVTSDSFKAFTNHPAVAAALKAIGLAAPEFNDKDMIAEAAHNSAGKKSSYWQKYFRKINAPLPSGKFSSMKYLNGDIKDLGPAQINDRSKNKYGIKGVANEANEQEKGTQSGGGVDLSQLMASARGSNGEEAAGEAGMNDSAYRAMELGNNSSFAPFVGRKTIMSKGGASDKRSALEAKTKSDAANSIPHAGTPKMAARGGRVSGFSWSRMTRGKRSNAFGAGNRSGKSPMTQMQEAYAYGMLAKEDDVTGEIRDVLAGAAFDGNDTTNTSMLDTGEPVEVPQGSFAGYVSGAQGALNKATACMEAMTQADADTQDLMEENKKLTDSMDFENPPQCNLVDWPSYWNDWNRKVDKMKANCKSMQKAYDTANTEKCGGEFNVVDSQCNDYEQMKRTGCWWLKAFWETLAWFAVAVVCGGVFVFTILMAIPSVRDWFRQNVGGFLDKINGVGGGEKPEDKTDVELIDPGKGASTGEGVATKQKK